MRVNVAGRDGSDMEFCESMNGRIVRAGNAGALWRVNGFEDGDVGRPLVLALLPRDPHALPLDVEIVDIEVTEAPAWTPSHSLAQA